MGLSVATRDAVFNPHPVPNPNIGMAGLRQRLVRAIAHANRELDGIRWRLVSFSYLIADKGTTGRAKYGRGGLAVPAANLVAQDASHHRPDNGTSADARARWMHQFYRLHNAIFRNVAALIGGRRIGSGRIGGIHIRASA
jgi:hypothetical protein